MLRSIRPLPGRWLCSSSARAEWPDAPHFDHQRVAAMGGTLKFGGQQAGGDAIVMRDGPACDANDHRSRDSKAAAS